MDSKTATKPVPQYRAFGSNGISGPGTLADILAACVTYGIDAEVCELDDHDGLAPIGWVFADGTTTLGY